jgi:hypothetical protein
MDDVDAMMLELFKQGLVEVEYDENLEAKFHMTEEARQILSANGFDYFYDDNE